MSREAISDNFGTSKKTMNLFTAMPGFQIGKREKRCNDETLCFIVAILRGIGFMSISGEVTIF